MSRLESIARIQSGVDVKMEEDGMYMKGKGEANQKLIGHWEKEGSVRDKVPLLEKTCDSLRTS